MTKLRKLILALNPHVREFVMAKMHIDLGTVLGLAPDIVRLIALIVKAKKGKSEGGTKITLDEREEILEAVEALLHNAVEDEAP